MRNKTLNLISKITIVLILALMVFSPNLLVSKATSYTYDFWKNVIPSAEGLAYRETYYNNDIKDINGNTLTGDDAFNYDSLTDMAVYEDLIFILDSKKLTETLVTAEKVVNGYKYSEIKGTGVSTVYLFNSNFRLVEALNEFVITDEVKAKLDEYYDFDYELYQISTSNLTATELVDYFTTAFIKTYAVQPGQSSVVIPTSDFTYGTYSNGVYTFSSDRLNVYLGGKLVDSSLWDWQYTANGYEIVLDSSLVSANAQELTAELCKVQTSGKAPYFAYSEDYTKAAIRLNNASGITVTDQGIYIADSGNARIIRVVMQNGIWVCDKVYLTPNDTAFYQVADGKKIIDTTDRTLFNPQKIAVDNTERLYCIAQNVYEGIIEFNTSTTFNRFLGKNEVVANPLKKFWSKIFSETQISSLKLDLPPEFTNICCDTDGFLYATSYPDANATASAKMVKMINNAGSDILRRNGYVTPDGDAVYISSTTEEGVITGASNLVGVTVSKSSNFTVVDELRGRLFTYDNEGNLLYITGEQPGGLSSSSSTSVSNSIIEPVAIRYFYRDSVDAEGNVVGEEEILLVLDATSKSILLYETTEFGAAVNKATELYQNGIIEDQYLLDEAGNPVLDQNGNKIITQLGAESYWHQVRKMDTNYELACLGIGKALHRRGQYQEAMEYFKLAHNATYYSKSYQEYRDQVLSENFNWIMTGVILLVVLWMVLKYKKFLNEKNLQLAAQAALNEEKAAILNGKADKFTFNAVKVEEDEEETPVVEEEQEEVVEKKITWAKIKAAIKVFFYETVKQPLYLLSHPIQGFTEFKIEKKGKAWVAWVIILEYVLMTIVKFQFAGIATNTNNPQDFNSITMVIYGILPPVIIAVANWSVTTLLDGKGKMGEIFKMIGYSLFPVMILGFFNVILSNFITVDEAQFVMLINIVAWVMTCYMVFMGLLTIHEYGMGKTIVSIIFTVVAILIIAFVALLVFDLAQQMYGFVYSLYKEITTRFF